MKTVKREMVERLMDRLVDVEMKLDDLSFAMKMVAGDMGLIKTALAAGSEWPTPQDNIQEVDAAIQILVDIMNMVTAETGVGLAVDAQDFAAGNVITDDPSPRFAVTPPLSAAARSVVWEPSRV